MDTKQHFRESRDRCPVSYLLSTLSDAGQALRLEGRSPTRASLQGCVSRSTPHHLRSLTRATSIRRSERAFRIRRDASQYPESRDRDRYSVSYLLRSCTRARKRQGGDLSPPVNSRQTNSPPLAPIHPRKLSRLRQSLGLTPLAQLHPRNLDSPQRTRLPRPPRRIAVLVMSRPPSSLLPLAQPYPRRHAFASAAKSKTPATALQRIHHLRSLTRAREREGAFISSSKQPSNQFPTILRSLTRASFQG